jgi:hypothetical protein
MAIIAMMACIVWGSVFIRNLEREFMRIRASLTKPRR